MKDRLLPFAYLIVTAQGCDGANGAPKLESVAEAHQPSDTSSATFVLRGQAVQGALLRGAAPPDTVRLSLAGTPVPIAADGQFIIAFDRDAPSEAVLFALLRDGRTVSQTIHVKPRTWKLEHVNVAQRPTGATADYLARRKSELERIRKARAVGASSGGWRQEMMQPTQGRISGVFGSQRIYKGQPGAFHTGTDIAAGAGAPVVAPADGVVVLAGPPMFSLEGNLVIVDHGMGLNSAFLHLAQSLVQPGQIVRQGELIGRAGATGRTTGPHLHWSMKWGNARIDPKLLLAAPVARHANGSP